MKVIVIGPDGFTAYSTLCRAMRYAKRRLALPERFSLYYMGDNSSANLVRLYGASNGLKCDIYEGHFDCLVALDDGASESVDKCADYAKWIGAEVLRIKVKTNLVEGY